MKTLLKQVAAALFASLISFNTFAEIDNTEHFEEFKNDFDIETYKQQFKKLNQGYLVAKNSGNGKSNKKPKDSDEQSIQGPASPLYYLEMISIASEHHPYFVDIGPNDFATIHDHGGSFIYIVTLEGGHADPYSRRMKINGNNLVEMYSEYLYGSDNSMIGKLHIWGTTSYVTSGTATYEATSITSPWNTMTDRLTIQ